MHPDETQAYVVIVTPEIVSLVVFEKKRFLLKLINIFAGKEAIAIIQSGVSNDRYC